MNLNQVIVKFRINNIIKSINNEDQIHSIELNIIDSAILKLVRDEVIHIIFKLKYEFLKKFEKDLLWAIAY